MASIQDKAESLASETFDWLFDHFPIAMTALWVTLPIMGLAMLAWAVFVGATTPEGSRWAAFWLPIVWAVVTLATWLSEWRVELVLLALLLAIIWHLVKIDRRLKLLTQALSLSFTKATAIHTAQYPVFSVKELIEARERMEEAEAAVNGRDGQESFGASGAIEAAMTSSDPIPMSLWERMKAVCELNDNYEFAKWRYGRIVEANLRVVSGKETIEEGRAAVDQEARQRDPYRLSNLGVHKVAKDWALRLFGEQRVPFRVNK